jgi:transposase InsO family protein
VEAADTTHMVDRRCRENGIEHRLARIGHPWTSGQGERMNRTSKEATVKPYHYDSHAQLSAHLHDFINACNQRRRLKTRRLTPYEYSCKCSTAKTEHCRLKPYQQITAPNI